MTVDSKRLIDPKQSDPQISPEALSTMHFMRGYR